MKCPSKHAQMPKRLCSLLLALLFMVSVLPAAFADEAAKGGSLSVVEVDRSELGAGFGAPQNAEKAPEEDAPEYDDADIVRVSIVLEGKSAVEKGFSTAGIAADAAANAYQRELLAGQKTMERTISEQILGGRKLDTVWNLTMSANLISANVEYGALAAISALPGVEAVYIEPVYEPAVVGTDDSAYPTMLTSGAMIGSAQTWAAGYTGAGSRIAIIDTGTDTDHISFANGALLYSLEQNARDRDMSYEAYLATLALLDEDDISQVLTQLNAYESLVADGASLSAEELYLCEKLPYTYNYVDKSLDVTHDNDSQGGHGSHVAGIAAANRYIPEGDGYVSAESVGVSGVAPDAQIITMKVFGIKGGAFASDYMAAIEDAIVLGCDAVNLSLGSSNAGFSYTGSQYYDSLMEQLAATDTVVSMSAGNDSNWATNDLHIGYMYSDEGYGSTVGSPGSYTNAFTVASVDNSGRTETTSSRFDGGDIVYVTDTGTNYGLAGWGTLDLGEGGSGTAYDYVFLGDPIGKQGIYAESAADFDGLDAEGKIVLISRGISTFYEKINLAAAAGAKAVIVYNNDSGSISMNLSGVTATIPAVSITMADAESILEGATLTDGSYGGTVVIEDRLSIIFGDENAALTMSSFSSWGTTGNLAIKPEITAPGGSIYSVDGGSAGTASYVSMSGTSMAAPQIAGMAAIAAEYIKGNALDELTGLTVRALTQSLLMSTAGPITEEASGTEYSVRRQGAGLANINSAVNSESYILVDGSGDGKVKAELGEDAGRSGSYTVSFSINSISDRAAFYELDASVLAPQVFEYEGNMYTDELMRRLDAGATYLVNGLAPMDMRYDLDGSGKVDEADARELLGLALSGADHQYGDMDGDGRISTYDVYIFLKMLEGVVVVPAGGSVSVTATISLSDEAKAKLDDDFENGAFVEGFIYVNGLADEEGALCVSHSIPFLSYYGNYTDASMYDTNTWLEYVNGLDTRTNHLDLAAENYFVIKYPDQTGDFYFGGNPYGTDKDGYKAERNAINLSGDAPSTIASVSFSMIRNAAALRFQVTEADTGALLYSSDLGTNVVAAYYYMNGATWQNKEHRLPTNWSGETNDSGRVSEGTEVRISLAAVPEYYVSEGVVDWSALGGGAYLSVSTTVDNTAPYIVGDRITQNEDTSYELTLRDDRYVAFAALYNAQGALLDSVIGGQETADSDHSVKLSLNGVPSNDVVIMVADYAANSRYYKIKTEYNGYAPLEEPGKFTAFSANKWVSVGAEPGEDGKITPETIYPNSGAAVTAAEIVDNYVFYVTGTTAAANLYVAPYEQFFDTTLLSALSYPYSDLAYNPTDGLIYGIYTRLNHCYLGTIDPVSGLETGVEEVEYLTATGNNGSLIRGIAFAGDGVLYAVGDSPRVNNAYPATEFYKIVLNDDEATMEQFKYTLADYAQISGLQFSTMVASMTWDDTDKCFYWAGAVHLFNDSNVRTGYNRQLVKLSLGEGETVTAATCGILDVSANVIALFPSGSYRAASQFDGTDDVGGVVLNRSSAEVFKGSTLQLTASVLPWYISDDSVIWTSSDTSVARINASGLVTGVGMGKATLTATSVLDPSRSATCELTVYTYSGRIAGALMDPDGATQIYAMDISDCEVSYTAEAAVPKGIAASTYDSKNKALWIMDGDGVLHNIDEKTGATIQTTPLGAFGGATPDISYSSRFDQFFAIYNSYFLVGNTFGSNVVGSGGDLSLYLRMTGSNRLCAVACGAEVSREVSGVSQEGQDVYLLTDNGTMLRLFVYDNNGSLAFTIFVGSTGLAGVPYAAYNSMHYDTETDCLFLSMYTGSTSEIYLIDGGNGNATYLLGNTGSGIWPATIHGVSGISEVGTTAKIGDGVGFSAMEGGFEFGDLAQLLS